MRQGDEEYVYFSFMRVREMLHDVNWRAQVYASNLVAFIERDNVICFEGVPVTYRTIHKPMGVGRQTMRKWLPVLIEHGVVIENPDGTYAVSTEAALRPGRAVGPNMVWEEDGALNLPCGCSLNPDAGRGMTACDCGDFSIDLDNPMLRARAQDQ